jgi:hypothetical protein
LNGRNLGEAVEGYLRNVATVKRKDIGEAVTEFLNPTLRAQKPSTDSGRNLPPIMPTIAKFNSQVCGHVSEHRRL